jgi:hypothetical protein
MRNNSSETVQFSMGVMILGKSERRFGRFDYVMEMIKPRTIISYLRELSNIISSTYMGFDGGIGAPDVVRPSGDWMKG